MPASRKKCGACLKLALLAAIERKAACSPRGAVLPVSAKCPKGHVTPDMFCAC